MYNGVTENSRKERRDNVFKTHVQYVQFRRFNFLLKTVKQPQVKKELSDGLGKGHIGLWSNGLI